MLIIDQIAYGNRFLNNSPVIKTVSYVVLLVVCLIGTVPVQALVMVAIALITLYASKLSFKGYLKWFILPFPFLLVSVLTIALALSKDPLVFEKSLRIGSFYLGWTSAGFELALKLVFRSLSCLVCTYLFIFTVPFQQIILVMKKVNLPSILIEISMLMYRFIFIFIESALAIYQSQQLRFGYKGVKVSYNSLGRLMQLVMIEMLKSYQQMTIALDFKFYQGEFPVGE